VKQQFAGDIFPLRDVISKLSRSLRNEFMPSPASAAARKPTPNIPRNENGRGLDQGRARFLIQVSGQCEVVFAPAG
jgi:hypothetical protein